MKIKVLTIFKIILILILFAYIKTFPISHYTNTFDAVLTLLLSAFLLYKSRKNQALVLMVFFIFYCNYSIVLSEYIIGEHLSVPLFEAKNIYNYGISIRILLLFMSIITLFFKDKTGNFDNYKIIPKDNKIIFYSIIAFLIYTFIFEIQRGDLDSYSVRITPIYEYSKLLFLFAYYFSGKSVIRKSIFSILIALFILQDLYYGGRITSLQLIILFSITLLIEKLSFKKIIYYGFIGVLISSLVSAYRHSYTLNSINPIELFKKLFNNYFVFDTPVYAYYASATFVAAYEVAESKIRTNSLLIFVKSIIFGSDDIIGELTIFVSRNYFVNVGGGLIPTYFYFWLGWLGVIFIACVLVFVLNNLNYIKNDYQKLLFVAIVFNVPRWYLYSPNALFRGVLFFTTLLYIMFLVINTITLKNFKKQNTINRITNPEIEI